MRLRTATTTVLAALLLTGCSQPVEWKDRYDPNGLQPEIGQQLTPSEYLQLEAIGAPTVKVGEHTLAYTVPRITNSDGSQKNGRFTQSQHLRMVLDTTDLPYHCEDTKHWESGFGGKPVTPNKDGAEDCLAGFTIVTSPTDDSNTYGEGDERATNKDFLVHGVNTIDLDAINPDHIKIMITLASGKYTFFDALTGETHRSEVIAAAQKVTATTTPGLTGDQENQLSRLMPHYVHNGYFLEAAPATVTKDDNGRSTLSVPVKALLSDADCLTSEVRDCHTLTVWSAKPSSPHSAPGAKVVVPLTGEFNGTLRIDTKDYETVYLEIRDGIGTEQATLTTVNLITGRDFDPQKQK